MAAGARLPPSPFARCALLTLAACSTQPERSAAPHYVLVSQAGSTTLAVVDPAAGAVVQRLTLGELPHRLLRNRAGSRVYAVLVGSQAVAEIDTSTLRVLRTFLTAPVPSTRDDGSAIEEHESERASDHTTCFDCHRPGGAQPAVVGARPVGIALSEDETQLYVSHIRGALLSAIDLASGAIERSVALPASGSAVEAADLTRVNDMLAVSLRPTQPSTDPGVVRLLDIDTFATRAEFSVGSDPESLTALPERDSVLVSNFDSDSLVELGRARTPSSYRVTPGPLGSTRLDGSRVLALDYYSNAASLVDLDSAEVTQLALQRGGTQYVNPTHAALDPDGRVAYVVSSGTDGHLLELELSTGEVQGVVPIDGLSFDALTIPRSARAPYPN